MNTSTKKQVVKTLAAMLVVVLVLGLVKFIQIRRAISEHARFSPPPETVTTSIVKQEQWRDSFQTVGSFAAVKGSTLGTQEAGNVVRVGFESGSKVVEGQMLLELDRSVEEANLQGALARLELAKQNLVRAKTLKGQSAISLANYDDAEAKVKQAEAEVHSIRGVIERKTIEAPFAGRAGIRAVNVGQYVNAGTPLVPLYSVDPIHFNFSVPQQIAPALKGVSGDSPVKASIRVDAFAGREFEGTITAVNPNVNEVTRSVDVQVTVPNLSEELLPGMFGEVSLELGTPKEVVAIPLTAIQYAPYGSSVYVIQRASGDAGGTTTTVRQQIVQLGVRRGDLVAVVHGLQTGDEVVILGGFKLRPNAAVVISADKNVPAKLNPEVKDS